MLCGCPVVISDQIRGRFDLVRPGLTGDIFPCGDVDALAAVLKRMLIDRAGLGTLAANARQRMETWSPREYIAAVVEAVRRVASGLGRLRSLLHPAPARHSRSFLSVLKFESFRRSVPRNRVRLFAVHCRSPHRAPPQCR